MLLALGRTRKVSLVLESEYMRRKHNQGSPNVKGEAMESLGPRDINCWQEEVRALKVNHFQSDQYCRQQNHFAS